jgi:hypothetical protein
MTRFPPYPKDILSRADALLSSKYPDGIVDPRFVEVACEAMMAQDAVALELLEALQAVVRVADRQTAEFDLARAAIAKAIRGTGQPPAPSPARDE